MHCNEYFLPDRMTCLSPKPGFVISWSFWFSRSFFQCDKMKGFTFKHIFWSIVIDTVFSLLDRMSCLTLNHFYWAGISSWENSSNSGRLFCTHCLCQCCNSCADMMCDTRGLNILLSSQSLETKLERECCSQLHTLHIPKNIQQRHTWHNQFNMNLYLLLFSTLN